jgi:hypothetical protein
MLFNFHGFCVQLLDVTYFCVRHEQIQFLMHECILSWKNIFPINAVSLQKTDYIRQQRYCVIKQNTIPDQMYFEIPEPDLRSAAASAVYEKAAPLWPWQQLCLPPSL